MSAERSDPVPTLYVTVGPPGAGKTTFVSWELVARGRVPATHVLSPDALLFDADRYAWSEARAGRAWKQVREDLARLLQTGRSVALDATSPRAADRAPFVRAARAAGYRTVAIFFDVPREAAEARDRDRPGKDRPVGPEVVRRIADEVVPPTGEEGFDEVWEVGEEGRLVAGTRPCGE